MKYGLCYSFVCSRENYAGKNNMANLKELTLYHGSTAREVTPAYGLGDDRHDYGRGFYLTEDAQLAKEWAVCRPETTEGFVHAYRLTDSSLTLLDFTTLGPLAWMAELMKYRQPNSSRRFRILAERFVVKYGVNTNGYDLIRGWRANASYFYIVRAFMRDEVDVSILEELLSLGGLGIQYCLKTKRAFGAIKEMPDSPQSVDVAEFNAKYNARDAAARENMERLINGPSNPATRVLSVLLGETPAS